MIHYQIVKQMNDIKLQQIITNNRKRIVFYINNTMNIIIKHNNINIISKN